MHVAYLTNRYPATSHTFIRREIAGVERAGLRVERISIRAADAELVDAHDRAERARTRVLLGGGALGLLPSALVVAVAHPLRTSRALRTAVALGRHSTRGLPRHLAYLAEASVLLRWCERLGIEHVHAHFATNPAAVALLCRELGGPSYSFTAHGTADLGTAGASALARKIEHASFAVAVCEDGLRRLASWAPRGHEHKLHIVRCGVDAEFLAAAPPGARAVPAAARLVCVARLSPEKGLDVLLRAARRLMEDGLEFEIAVLGDGPQRAELECLRGALGLTRHVRFEGWKSGADVRARILGSRALVLASHSEGLPVVIMEALALGRPVISTAVGGIAELVVPGVCGWLVPPLDERALAAAMADALRRSPSELEALGERGAARVAARHQADEQAGVIARLLLASRRAEPARRGRRARCVAALGSTQFPVWQRVLRSIGALLRRT
jgi:glycosyltransferase involved in cell wall biosynthesis